LEEAKRIREISLVQLLDGDSSIGMPKGVITLAEEWMEINDWDEEHIAVVMKALHFLKARAAGEIPTAAIFMQNYVCNHPSYQRDSVVCQRVLFDLLRELSILGSRDGAEGNSQARDWA